MSQSQLQRALSRLATSDIQTGAPIDNNGNSHYNDPRDIVGKEGPTSPYPSFATSPVDSREDAEKLTSPIRNSPVTSRIQSRARTPSPSRLAKKNTKALPDSSFEEKKMSQHRQRELLGIPLPFQIPRLNIVLENSGSVARDHLASERTFLAYARTSLALASAGVALVQLFSIADLTNRAVGVQIDSPARAMQRFAQPLGILMIALALVVVFIGACRYFSIQKALPEGKFPVARLSIFFFSFVLGAVTVVIFGALVKGR